jgi:DNA-binding transcriptional regulator YdaS (Cro superfamily)
MNAVVDAIRKHGITKLAREIGVPTQTLWNWLNRPPIRFPAESCAAMERALGRNLRRWHLRPTDWHQIWPELIGTVDAPPVPFDGSTAHQRLPEASRAS